MFQEKQHPLTLKQSPLVAVEIWYQGGCMGRSNGGRGQSFSYLLPRPWLFRDLKDVVIIVSRPPKVPSTKERSNLNPNHPNQVAFVSKPDQILPTAMLDQKTVSLLQRWFLTVLTGKDKWRSPADMFVCVVLKCSHKLFFILIICWASSVSFGWI